MKDKFRRSFLIGSSSWALALFLGRESQARDYHDREVLLSLLRKTVPVSYPTDVKIGRILSDYRSMVGVDGKTRRTRTGPNPGPDFEGRLGDSVIAAAAGWAQYRHDELGGKIVDVFHDVGFHFQPNDQNPNFVVQLKVATAYSHLRRSLVDIERFSEKTGRFKWVNRGETIGEMGFSGSGGNRNHIHLDFSVWTNGPGGEWDSWHHINPHLLWAGGPGKVTPFVPGTSYNESRLALTAPTLPKSK